MQQVWRTVLTVLLLTRVATVSVSFTGTGVDALTQDDEVKIFPFTFSTVSEVMARTWSFGGGVNGAGDAIPAGGFPTVLALFEASGNQDLLQLAQGSVNGCGPGATTDPVSGFCWDAYLQTTLVAGDYLLTLSQDGNTPIGPVFSDGFLETGNPSYTGVNYLGDDTRRFILIDKSQRSGDWVVDLLITPLQTLVSGTVWLMLAGFAAWTMGRRRGWKV